ncbi:MAG: prepilin-type N-terminal cleavage/methylation domain-containing protein [Bacilli bacterium]|nr:prepilin-type N-terminal cleavage/methylation domain-containing protein [Bacilli bacterium]
MKKGFTLIELLAVIVILAIIALISVPMILGIVEKVKKGALGATANGLLESATLYYAKNLSTIGENKVFLFDETHDGETSDNIKLTYKGDFKGTGSVRIYKDGKTAICIQDEKYYAIKNINNTKVTTGTGTCSYDEATNTYLSVNLVSQELVDNLQEQVDALQDKVNTLETGREAVTNALINKGVSITLDDDLDTIAATINNTTIGTRVINLGTGTSFDLKTNYVTYGLSATEYQNLTSDNFVVELSSTYVTGLLGWSTAKPPKNAGGSNSYTVPLTKTYNATTGVVTVGGISGAVGYHGFADTYGYAEGRFSSTVNVYLKI